MRKKKPENTSQVVLLLLTGTPRVDEFPPRSLNFSAGVHLPIPQSLTLAITHLCLPVPSAIIIIVAVHTAGTGGYKRHKSFEENKYD